MGHIFHCAKLNRLLLSSILITFSLASFPTPCFSQIAINNNDIAFAYRIEKIIEKIKKASGKNDSNTLIDLMLEAKREIEIYSGMQIDLGKQLDAVESEFRKLGTNVPKKEYKELRKVLKKREKKDSHRASCLENYILNPEMPYSLENEELLYIAKHGHEETGDAGIEIPVKLTVGVTVALVGLFIMVVPVIPAPIKPWGKDLVIYGAGIAAEACYSGHDDRNKKN